MYKRRDIREAAVQFLYFSDLESGPETQEMEQALWEMIQEEDLRKLSRAKFKAVLHVLQGRDTKLAKLIRHAEELSPLLKADPGSESLYQGLSKILKQESRMNAVIDIFKTLKPTDQDNTHQDPSLADIIQVNSSLMTLRHAFLDQLPDFPQWKNALEPVTAAIQHLNRVSERLCAIDDPTSTMGDFTHIQKITGEMKSFRDDVHALVNGVQQQRETIDTTIGNIVTNYAPDRIAPVDRSILRLSVFEILFCEEIPKAVSINEAIEIAKQFSTSESGRFINGVLDAI